MLFRSRTERIAEHSLGSEKIKQWGLESINVTPLRGFPLLDHFFGGLSVEEAADVLKISEIVAAAKAVGSSARRTLRGSVSHVATRNSDKIMMKFRVRLLLTLMGFSSFICPAFVWLWRSVISSSPT